MSEPFNPRHIPMIGGPLDGLRRDGQFFLDSKCAVSQLFRSGTTLHRYKIDHTRQAWVYDKAARVPASR